MQCNNIIKKGMFEMFKRLKIYLSLFKNKFSKDRLHSYCTECYKVFNGINKNFKNISNKTIVLNRKVPDSCKENKDIFSFYKKYVIYHYLL